MQCSCPCPCPYNNNSNRLIFLSFTNRNFLIPKKGKRRRGSVLDPSTVDSTPNITIANTNTTSADTASGSGTPHESLSKSSSAQNYNFKQVMMNSSYINMIIELLLICTPLLSSFLYISYRQPRNWLWLEAS